MDGLAKRPLALLRAFCGHLGTRAWTIGDFEHAVPISAHRAQQAAPSRGELMVTDADNMRAGGGQQRRGIKRICVIDEDSDED